MNVAQLINALQKVENKKSVVTFEVSPDYFMPISSSIREYYCINRETQQGEVIVVLKQLKKRKDVGSKR